MPTDARIAGGHKANLNNPNTSQESKKHSKQVLENDFNDGNVPKAGDSMENKNPDNVAVGLKATTKNPNISKEAKQSAKERLNQMGER